MVKLKTAKGVDEHLEAIDYDWKNYKPTLEALEFTTFMQEVNGGEDDNKTTMMHTAMMEKVFNKRKRSLILVHRGAGKLETEDSPILTPSGWTTMGRIKVGDTVINRHGKAVAVDYKTEAQYPDTYLMTLTDNTTMEVGDEHNHIVWVDRRTPKKGRNTEKVMTTLELINKGLVVEAKNRTSSRAPKKNYRFGIPLVAPIEFNEAALTVAPYVMGYGLANAYFKDSTVSAHADDLEEVKGYFVDEGYACGVSNVPDNTQATRFRPLGIPYVEFKHLRSRTKYIPNSFMFSSITQRTELLRGLMDGDGSIAKNGGVSYSSFNERLATDVRDLARSLGAISYIKDYTRERDNVQSTEYIVIINIKVNPFKLKRKADKWKPTKKMTRGIVSLEPIGKKKGYCIQVADKTHSYIANGFTVTHNTTIFAEMLFLHIAAFGKMPGFGKVSLALYISDSVENGVKNLRRNVEHRYAESEMMQKLVPNRRVFVGNGGIASRDVTSEEDYKSFEEDIGAGKKFTDIRLEFKNWRGDTFVVKGYSASVGIRGAKEMGQRPQLAIFDDILSDTDANSPTIIANIENSVYKAVSKALDPTRQKQIWLGTPFNQTDPIYKAAESGAWDVACYPIAQEFDATTTRETFKGSWPERFDFDYVKDEFDTAIALGRPDDFYQELMLQISNSDDRLIKDNDIVWFNRDAMIANKGTLNYYITTDAATTDNAKADFSVIMVWGVNHTGDILLMDFWFGKVLLSDFINNLFRLVNMWSINLLGVGIEVSGQQGGTISTIKDKMIRENTYFFLLSSGNNSKEGIRPAPGTRKYERFQAMQPLFSNKKIWFPDNLDDDPFMIELMTEIKYVGRTNTGKRIGKSKNDDILDTIAMLSMLKVIAPMKSTLPTKTVTRRGSLFDGVDDYEEVDACASYC